MAIRRIQKIAKIAKPTIEISDKVRLNLEWSKKIAKEKSENSDDMRTLLRPRSRMLLKGARTAPFGSTIAWPAATILT
jgi:hypothetical protein